MKFESTILSSDSGKKDFTDSAVTVNASNLKPNRIFVRQLSPSVCDVQNGV